MIFILAILVTFLSPLIWASDYFGWIIGGVSIAVSVLLFFWSRKKRIPIYRCRTTRLITSSIDQIDGLDIFYEKKKLKALSISKVALWNAGRDTISGTDVSELDKLRISIDTEYEILSCDILTQTKRANNFSAQIADDKKSIDLAFDYFDHNEGVVLKIRHTGSSSSDIIVSGSIKAVREVRRINETLNITPDTGNRFLKMRKNRWWILLLGVLMLAFAFLLLFYLDWLVDCRIGWKGVFFGRTSFFVLLLFFSYLSSVFLYRFSLISKKPIPESLFSDYVNEDF